MNPGLGDAADAGGVGHVRRVVEGELPAVGQRHAVDHARRRRHEVEVELALQPLLHDFEMEEAEKAAANPKPSAGELSAS